MEYAFEPVPATEAVDFIRRKAPLRKAQFEKLPRELQALAFTVNGINAADALQDIRDTVATMPAGERFLDVQKKVAAKLQRYVGADQLELIDATPEEKKEQQKKLMARARGIVRQHGNQAYAVTAWQDLEDNADIYPYWKYITVGDGHVRDTHRALDNLVLPKSHEFWQTHFPPWEFGCRCQVVPVTEGEYKRYQQADEGKDAAKRTTLTEAQLEQLTNERSLTRMIGGAPVKVDLRAPVEKMIEHPYVFDPSSFRIPLASIAERYDAATWADFEKMARGVKLPEGGSLWQWMNKGRQSKSKSRSKSKMGMPGGKFPDDLALEVVKKLGGSTGALMVRDAFKRPFVMKKGNSPEHLQEEFTADTLYQALGVPVPEARLYDDADGRPVKLAEFVHGQTLDKYLAGATAAEKAAVLGKLKEDFLADALLGNWDVAGMNLDNVMVDAAGLPWRIDNGGSLRFRAMGERKAAGLFGAEVQELKTLLDAKVNPSTAKVFAGLTEEDMAAQWEKLKGKREALLAAAPAELRGVLGERMDWLERRFAPKTFAAGFAKDVKKAKLMGRTHLGDLDMVEDTTVLFWEEKNAAGQPLTRAKLRLTQKGSDAIVAKYGSVLQKTGAVASTGKRVLPGDVFWADLTAPVKHINHHAADGKYNPAKVQVLDVVSAKLDAFAATAKTQDEIAMVEHYRQMIAEAKVAMATKGKTPWFDQYEPPAPVVVAPVNAPDGRRLEVKAEALAWKQKNKDRGIAQETGGEVRREAAYRLGELNGDGAMHFIPWTEANGQTSAAPYALRGYVEITIPGAVDAGTLERAATLMRESGVDIAAAPPAFGELLYLRKGLELQGAGLTPTRTKAWQAIADDTTLDDAAKVTKLKGWVEKTLKVPLTADNYRPLGKAGSDGSGWQHWERWDLPRAEVEAAMADYTLTHSTNTPLPALVDSILNSGGQFTPTTERLRTGVPINTGMSPEADLQSGGANYIFTRIAKKTSAKYANGFAFKVGNLNRLDSFSFDEDRYGDVRPKAQTHRSDARKKRARTLAQMQANSRHSGNETIFKWGLNLLDELEWIKTSSAAERAAVLKVFKDHKIDVLPDGRDVASVVI